MDFIDICNNPERFNRNNARGWACEDDWEYKQSFKVKVVSKRQVKLYDTKLNETFSKRMK